MTMTRVQAEALTAFVVRVRTDWRPAGVLAALEKAAPTTDVYSVAVALLNLAADETVKTPGLLPMPGPHWRKWDGSTPGRRGDHDMPCPEHPTQVHPCPTCKAEKPPLSDEGLAELRAVVAEGKTRVPKPRMAVAPRVVTDLETVRERADRAHVLGHLFRHPGMGGGTGCAVMIDEGILCGESRDHRMHRAPGDEVAS
jgi:hypothetical protein